MPPDERLGRARSLLGGPQLPLYAAVVLAFAGLFAAAVLSLGHLLNLPVPCGGSRGCATVAAHPGSKIGGVPIAYMGVGGYVASLSALVCSSLGQRGRLMLLVLTGLGAATSIGLLIYSKIVIGATCHWCIASGVAMVLLCVVCTRLAWLRGVVSGPRPVFYWAAAVTTALAVGLQAGAMQREAMRPPVPPERLASLTVRDLADDQKSTGDSSAPVTIVTFADFICPGCRATHEPLEEFARSNPKGVRLLYRHMPLWEMSAAAAAVSEIAAERGKFWDFVHQVNRVPPVLHREVVLDLVQRVGLLPDEVERRIANGSDPAVLRVVRDRELAESLGIRTTPTFIVFIQGQAPMSANQRTLPMIINSIPVQAHLAIARAEAVATQVEDTNHTP